MSSKLSQSIVNARILSSFALLFICTLGLYSASRLVFLLNNWPHFANMNSLEMLLAFIHGLRFDLASLAMINAPLLLILLLCSPFKCLSPYLNKFTTWWFLLSNVPFLLTNFADAAYFPFSGRRSGPEISAMLPDLWDQAAQLFTQFWYLILVVIIFIGLLSLATAKAHKYAPKLNIRLLYYPFACLLIIALCVLSIRGGLQRKPIHSIHAYSWPHAELGPLVLNTPFTMLKQKGNQLQELGFFPHNEQAKAVLPKPINDKTQYSEQPKDNVLIIILESMGLEYFPPPYGKVGYTPFIQSLADEGLFFPNSFANGRRSIDAVPSILAGMPSLMAEPFVRSAYQGNQIYGIGNILKNYGYQTWFFHGAKNGSMYFDAITQRLGMDNYVGRTEHNNEADFDGQWGIFDGPFLQGMARQLNQAQQPFLASVFTISSHNPYTLPAEYEARIPEGEIPMHRVVRYADMALEQFFASIKNEPWYQNTLFVITADHTSDNHDPDFASPLGRHRIPIILYHPQGKVQQQVRQDIAQQTDIPATIVDYLNIDASAYLLPFGESLLKQQRQGSAFFKEVNDYWLVSKQYSIRMKPDFEIEEPQLIPFIKQQEQAPLNEQALRLQLKANVQLYNNGLINNSFYE